MGADEKPFEVQKSFGLGVLLKLTQKTTKGINIRTAGDKFKGNVTLNELKDAVENTMKAHNIRLMPGNRNRGPLKPSR